MGISKLLTTFDNLLKTLQALLRPISIRISNFAPMEKIIRHIETLIRRHDYVIIPDLGGFVFQKQPATITPESINPPLTTISFNPLMNVSDGLLAIEISRAENISFRESMERINKFVETLKVQLAGRKVVNMGGIGNLLTGDDNKIIFTPSANPNFIPANFGQNTLHYAAFVKEEAHTEKRKVIQITLPTSRTMTRYAAAIAVVATLAISVPKITNAYQNFGSIIPTTGIAPAETKDAKAETTLPAVAITPTQNTSTTLDEATIATQSEATAAVEALTHHVIVSAMPSKAEADSYCNRLKALNYTQAHVLKPIKTYRIAICSFGSKEEAIKYMQDLRKNKPQFAEAWVLSE